MLFSDLLAAVSTGGLLILAYLGHKSEKANKKRDIDNVVSNETFMNQWVQNKEDHNFVVNQISTLGQNLESSINRVDSTVKLNAEVVVKIDKKLDTHIRDHAVGNFISKK